MAYTNPNVSPKFGMAQGFDEQFHRKVGRSARTAVEDAVGWLDRRDPECPFFLYVHTNNPHHPYRATPVFRRIWARESGEVLARIEANPRLERWEPTESNIRQLRHLYDAEIAWDDQAFGQLVEALRERGLYDDTLLVYVSDHGDEFYEHGGWNHGHNLHAESVNVPMIVRIPGVGSGRRVTEVAQHIDLLPTLLDELGLDLPGHLEGRSLLPLIEGVETAGATDGRRVFSHLQLYGLLNLSVVVDGWKLISIREGERTVSRQLYDLRSDPGEKDDLADRLPIRTEVLEGLLDARLRDSEAWSSQEIVLDAELEESLRALGYLD